MSLLQFFRILWARRLIIAVAVLGCFLTAIAIGKILPARYVATSRVMLDLVKPDPVTGEMIAGQFARAYTKTQVELIRDYRVAGRAADTLGWTASPQFAAQYEARSKDDTRDFRRWVAQTVIDGTDAKLIEGSNILEISFTSSSPETATKVADAIRTAYVDQAVALRRDDANKNASWFREQATRIRDELTQAERKKSDFERSNGIILDEANIDQESRRLTALAASAPVGPVAGGAIVTGGDPVAGQLAQVDAAIASAEKVLGPNNPDLLNMRRQRAAIVAGAAAARPVVSQAQASGPSLASLYGAQQAKVLSQRGKVEEARQLAIDVAVLRDQYQKTTARVADLQQQGEVSETGLTLLGNATAPESPKFPKWPLLILGSLGLGLVIGILVSLVIELLGRRVRGIEDMRFDAVPVLGVMTVSPRAAAVKRRWLSFRQNRSAQMEYA